MNFNLPEEIKKIREILSAAGHESYIVGGCVRDVIMGKTPGDYDITTSAEPHETAECFKDYKISENGIKHGTVAVVMNHSLYEITTYRTDGEYKDNRHPESVYFTKSLSEDLSRRDFTVNAMAYNPDSGIIDPFGGRDDIKRKIIRCVGNAEKRFEEDSLRILRGIRFASVLGFEIEEKTARAMHIKKELINNISKERIHTEFIKALMGTPDLLFSEYEDVFRIFLSPFTKRKINEAPKSKYLRLALILPKETAVGDLKSLKSDTKTVTAVREIHSFEESSERRELLLKAGRLKAASCRDVISYLEITGSSEKAEIIEKALEEKLCISLNDLAVDGTILHRAGIPKGKELGRILEALLYGVTEGRLPNERSILLNEALKIIDK